MGVEINLSGATISKNARVLNHAVIRNGHDVRIGLQNAEITDDTVVLENLEIDSVLDELSQKSEIMDKSLPEYSAIQKILNMQHWNKKAFAKCIARHLGEFSQGVLASVVASFLTAR